MNERSASPRVAITVATVIFFMWGFITVLNDVLIPHLKSVFTLSYAQAMLIQFMFFGAYFVMSIPAGKLIARVGYRNGMIIGLLVAGVGALMFIPAARMVSYEVFLSAFFVLASGITLLQVSANPYVSLLGEPRYASSRLNLAQAMNSLGTTLAPALGGMLILSGAVLGASELAALTPADLSAYRTEQAALVTGPYLGLAAVLCVLAVVVSLFRMPSLAEAAGSGGQERHGFAEVLGYRHVRMSVIAIFLYVGAEVSIGSFLINYLSMPSVGDISEAKASWYVSLYWGGAMIGRFFGYVVLRHLDPRRMLTLCALAAVLLLATTMLTQGNVALWSVVAIGLFNSIMFPNIFTFGIERMGRLTGKASSLLIMAIVGGALIPVLQGVIADQTGLRFSFVLPLLCYVFIMYYGTIGSRVAEDVNVPGGDASIVRLPGH